ncbi:hypothetical protein JOD54_004529 [Actinokineospora baliensis]|uniref:hypothetical protein n=1 Tax=Actinokineospora baliensis TaxID=547056 RepID=UPI001956EABA|nr:hypothetical protein [Actinokineospora baliensis]MBM7774325.1 hypothetical protein [Actinokineospora baliensis]
MVNDTGTTDLQIHVQTRGTVEDYTFLAGPGPSPWWRAHAKRTRFEEPVVLVESDPDGWRCYVGGLATDRADRVGTTIRVSVVFEGAHGAHEQVVRLVAAAITAIGSAGAARLPVLDEQFTADYVDGVLQSTVTGDDAGARVLAAIEELPAQTLSTARHGSWAGGVAHPNAAAAFAERTSALLSGKVGVALYLNEIASADEASDLLDRPGEVALLVPGDEGITPLRPKARAPMTARSETSRWWLMAVVTTAAILLAAVIRWIFWSS